MTNHITVSKHHRCRVTVTSTRERASCAHQGCLDLRSRANSPLKNVCHGCVSRGDVGKRLGISHCRDGSGTLNGVFQQTANQLLLAMAIFVSFVGCTPSGGDDGLAPANKATASTSPPPAQARELLEANPAAPLPGVWSVAQDRELAPFWCRDDHRPTYAPLWYANKSPVTHEMRPRAGERPAKSGDRLYRLLQSLKPGDHLLIHPGTYLIDRWVSLNRKGTEQAPITIRGIKAADVVITRSNAEKNVIDIDQSQYLILESLTIRGGSNGIKFYTADHVMVHDVTVTETDGSAITANAGPTSFLAFVDCDLSHTGGHGEGLYLGGHDGSNITHHTAVVGNYIHDLMDDDVNQGDGVEVKEGSYAVWVKYNFIRETNYPGITVYGTGRPLSDRNVIEDNVVLHSNDYAMQISGDAIVRNNLVVNALGNGRAFLSKPERSVPSHLLLVDNTFLATGRAVTRNGWDHPKSQGIVFANNAVYSQTEMPTYGDATKAARWGNVSLEALPEIRAGSEVRLALLKLSSQGKR